MTGGLENDNVAVIPNEVPGTPSLNGNVSGITEESGSPKMPTRSLTATEMGLPPTPEQNMNFVIDENMNDEGYDSNGDIGPVRYAPGIEEDINVDEDEVLIQIPNPNEVENDSNENIGLTDDKIEKMKVSELKEALGARNLSKNGVKAVLISRLKQAVANGMGVVENINPNIISNMAGENFEPMAHWELLTPDTNSVVEENLRDSDGYEFYAPIASGAARAEPSSGHALKMNYREYFERPKFLQPVYLPKFTRGGRPAKDTNGDTIYESKLSEDTHPNVETLHRKGINLNSHPAEWFDIFMPKHSKRQSHPDEVTVADFTTWTNKKMILMNAGKGGSVYPNCHPFSVDEVMQHIGLYILQGLAPSPQIEMKFQSTEQNEVNGNDFVCEAFGKNAAQRHREFKCFFATVDPALPVPSRLSHPNWKVAKFFRHAIRISKECIHVGVNISIDEQTIGCQGRHPDILRINYKAEGDGFQCDALCCDGYTYTFYFRNQPPPKVFTDMKMSPLHARVHALLEQLPLQHYKCAMDNLYISAKLCR